MADPLLTVDERIALHKLADAWNAYLALPVEHPDDVDDFRRLIHAANAQVLKRPGRRQFNG